MIRERVRRWFENRLPRGRTYVRNGSVVHLEVEPGTRLVLAIEGTGVEIGVAPLGLSPPGGG